MDGLDTTHNLTLLLDTAVYNNLISTKWLHPLSINRYTFLYSEPWALWIVIAYARSICSSFKSFLAYTYELPLNSITNSSLSLSISLI